MEDLIIISTDITPGISFLAESGDLEMSGVSRPDDVAGFYETPLQWLADFKEALLRAENKYGFSELNLRFKLSYFNSSSSKFIIQMLRHIKDLVDKGILVNIDWYYEEGDEKMMEDGEDLAEAVDLRFNYMTMEG